MIRAERVCGDVEGTVEREVEMDDTDMSNMTGTTWTMPLTGPLAAERDGTQPAATTTESHGGNRGRGSPISTPLLLHRQSQRTSQRVSKLVNWSGPVPVWLVARRTRNARWRLCGWCLHHVHKRGISFGPSQPEEGLDIQPGQLTPALTSACVADTPTTLPDELIGLLEPVSNNNFNQPPEPNQVMLPTFDISLSCASNNSNIEVDNSAVVSVADSDRIETVNSADVGDAAAANNPDDDIEIHKSPFDNVTEYHKSDTRLYDLDNCNVLVIGDSNLRFMGGLPTTYQVAVMPGARFMHITEVVKALPKSSTFEHIVVAAGINHRDRDYNKETLPASDFGRLTAEQWEDGTLPWPVL